MEKYKVANLQGNIYQVFVWNPEIVNSFDPREKGDYDYNDPLFQGTLPECEAWINLKEKGYL
jgi:hypothetical protein